MGIAETLEAAVNFTWMALLREELPSRMLPLSFACAVSAGNEALARDLQLELADEARWSAVGNRDARNFYCSLKRQGIIQYAIDSLSSLRRVRYPVPPPGDYLISGEGATRPLTGPRYGA